MGKLSTIKISKFNNLKATNRSEEITLYDELRHIKYGTYKETIIKCRNALSDGDKELYTTLKAYLPAVTFSGIFGMGRKAANIIRYNHLMVLDIDHLPADEVQSTKDTLSKDRYVLAIWLSPSGNGLKCLIRIGSEQALHKMAFNSLSTYFLNNYKIEIDKSGKDVSRLCFTSWDESIYFNVHAEIYDETLDLVSEKKEVSVERQTKNVTLSKSAFATEGLNRKDEKYIIRKIIDFLNKRQVSITSDHNSWLKVALAISYSFTYDVGEKFFLSLCRLDKDKHDEQKSIRLLKGCYNKRKIDSTNTISFGTIIFLAGEKGFVLKKKTVL